jgi:formylglycine-generating enzyme required for sulfatase activity
MKPSKELIQTTGTPQFHTQRCKIGLARPCLAHTACQLLAMAIGLGLCFTAHAQRNAMATASVTNGFVVSVTVTDGGTGYLVPPVVAFSGGEGSGATATASISGGAVTQIAVLTAGNGYTNAPTVIISRTAGESTVLDLQMIPMVTITGLPGDTNEVQFTTSLNNGGVWITLTNVVLTTGSLEWYDRISPPGTRGFYRTIRLGSGSLPTPGPGFVWVPPGQFTMGSPSDELGRNLDEGPQTIVTLTRGFFIGRHEVTRGEYSTLVGADPSHFTGGTTNYPVENLTWEQATNYCGTLTQRERTASRLSAGWVYRLPTEAEWEYACRAGTTNRFHYGNDPGAAQLGNYAWFYSNAGIMTSSVTEKLPNAWGLYDIAGNVLEWCLDWHAASYPGGSVTDPQGPAAGFFHVARGGGYSSPANGCRSAYRWGECSHCWDVGFRIVLAPVP